MKLSRQDIILAALSASANGGQEYDSVQLQKLLFLIDESIAKNINGSKFFHFQPYNYGPFDKSVYNELNELVTQDLAMTYNRNSISKYMLTPLGYKKGKALMETLPINERNFVIELNKFVTELSFKELVSAIYKRYPHMKANSIFFE